MGRDAPVGKWVIDARRCGCPAGDPLGQRCHRARHAAWVRPRGLCPRCQLEPDDREHRRWRCPEWEAARTAAPGLVAASQALRRRLPDGVALTGILQSQPALKAMLAAAEADEPHVPAAQLLDPMAPRPTIWTDGSCVHPDVSLLTRAAGGLRAAATVGAGDIDLAGPVDGSQAPQRAEVIAAVAATRQRYPRRARIRRQVGSQRRSQARRQSRPLAASLRACSVRAPPRSVGTRAQLGCGAQGARPAGERPCGQRGRRRQRWCRRGGARTAAGTHCRSPGTGRRLGSGRRPSR